MFLTPEGVPYFGGTYFPAEDRYGRPGFPRILVALSDAWKNEREEIRNNCRRVSPRSALMIAHPAGQRPRPKRRTRRHGF